VILNEDTVLQITLSASDVEGDSLSCSASLPAHGALTGTAFSLTYRPAPNYFGPDRFTFLANDGRTDSARATVDITVLPVNDPPVAVATGTSPSALSGNGTAKLIVIAGNNGSAEVILDGSSSSDIEQNPLELLWLLEDERTSFGAGVRVTNQFEVGSYQIILRVFDGLTTATTPLILEVTSPGEAVEMLTLQVNDAAFARKNKRPLIASLKSAAASFDRGNLTAGVNQLAAFQNKARAQLGPSDEAESLIKAAQDIIEALDGGRR
jgi:hypothetical protein